jgi:hypothetical protein
MSKASFAGLPPSKLVSTMFCWLEWQKVRGVERPTYIRVFHREEARLVVHEYGPHFCGVLKLSPRVQYFREWRQPLAVVTRKLQASGWVCGSEVDYVRH